MRVKYYIIPELLYRAYLHFYRSKILYYLILMLFGIYGKFSDKWVWESYPYMKPTFFEQIMGVPNYLGRRYLTHNYPQGIAFYTIEKYGVKPKK